MGFAVLSGIASIDLFVVPTIAFQRLFAFLVLGHERRRLLWFAVTRNPTADWLARQITEAFPWDGAPKYLIRDNDRAFGAVFKAHVRAMGIRDRPTSFRSPWQNGYVERLIGSIRRECTDHLLVFNAEHLRRILAKYATYYNEVRTHVSLGKDAPCGRPTGASFGAYRSNHIFRPEAPRRAAAGSETGLLFVLCHGLLPASACPLCGRGRRWRLRWPSVDSSHTIARPESMR